jgi:beta-glucosidase-like glycosyl hydrolase
MPQGRDPRWGRFQESISEGAALRMAWPRLALFNCDHADPWLNGAYSVQFVKGMQVQLIAPRPRREADGEAGLWGDLHRLLFHLLLLSLPPLFRLSYTHSHTCRCRAYLGLFWQGNDPTFLKLAATCKHFLAYSLEGYGNFTRHNFNAVVSEQDLLVCGQRK